MTKLSRYFVPGGTFWISAFLAEPGADLLVRHISALRTAYRRTYQERPFLCHAMVVLPDHLHAVWSLPPGDLDLGPRVRRMKARFTSEVRRRSGIGRQVWRSGDEAEPIADIAALERRIQDCWTDPVTHRVVAHPTDWVHSSIHRDILRGLPMPEVWSGPFTTAA